MPGKIEKYISPGGQGIFLHSFLHEGQEIYPYFDSLLAKLISWGRDREEAVSKLKRALAELTIEGVPTNTPFFKVLLEDRDFLAGNLSTNFIEKSEILKKILPLPPRKRISRIEEVKEEEIAEIVFQIYQSLKKESPAASGGEWPKETPSNWVMTERLKMYED